MSPAPPPPPVKTKRRPARRNKRPDNPPTPSVAQAPPARPAPQPQPQPEPAPQPQPAPQPRPVPQPQPAPVKAADPPPTKRPAAGTRGEGGVDEALAASQIDLDKLQAARRSRLIKAGVLTAIALVFIAFILQNATPVGLRVLAWTFAVRLIWIIVASALLGALAGYLVGRPDKNLLLHGPSRRQEDPR
jgi:uncharacterized integral membrane protein